MHVYYTHVRVQVRTDCRDDVLYTLYFILPRYRYAPIAEMMGRNAWCAEVFNCSAPDTGNAELLTR